MKKTNWLAITLIGIIALFVLFWIGTWIGGGYRGYGCMMGGYGGMMSGYGMMGNWGYSPFGWIGMLFMWLIPVGFIALVVFGIAWLVKNVNNSTPPAARNPCSNCGKSVQADWQNCPHCGTALK